MSVQGAISDKRWFVKRTSYAEGLTHRTLCKPKRHDNIDRTRPCISPMSLLPDDSASKLDFSNNELPQANNTGRCSVEAQVVGHCLGSSLRRERPILCEILDLPLELQYSILSHLDFGDIERLRRTCHFIRGAIPKPTVKRLFPDIREALLDTCSDCLQHFPRGSNLVTGDENDYRYPFASRCFPCAAQNGALMVGRKYQVNRCEDVWICRWCGFPALTTPWNQPEFHKKCYREFNQVMFVYFLLGIAQFTIAVIGCILCWRFYKGASILAPTITSLILTFGTFLLILFRGAILRTYHWSCVLEAVILCLWLPPLYTVVGHIQPGIERPSAVAITTITFIGLNVMARLLSVLGNLILSCEYKIWRQNKPRVSWLVRKMQKVVRLLIFWTYPQCVEQDYPPTWW